MFVRHLLHPIWMAQISGFASGRHSFLPSENRTRSYAAEACRRILHPSVCRSRFFEVEVGDFGLDIGAGLGMIFDFRLVERH